jgi:23S rRNA (adenine1618-N6)-methyltransferase
MHPKNIHQVPYNFTELIKIHPELAAYIKTSRHGSETIDFSDAAAVFELNKAILKANYDLVEWTVPEGYLCPPIPGRVDYLHHLLDLIGTKTAKGLDIGTGANCIYPLLGASIYGWKMTGTDIDANAIASAKENVAANPKISDHIDIRHQTNNANIFQGIIEAEEYFDFVMCNPPFYSSEKEAMQANYQKNKNLGYLQVNRNFGGQANELWCNGGESLFLKRMIKQSVDFKTQVGWFTALVSRKEHLPKLIKQLTKTGATHKIVDMEQGNKQSRFVAWTFGDQ